MRGGLRSGVTLALAISMVAALPAAVPARVRPAPQGLGPPPTHLEVPEGIISVKGDRIVAVGDRASFHFEITPGGRAAGYDRWWYFTVRGTTEFQGLDYNTDPRCTSRAGIPPDQQFEPRGFTNTEKDCAPKATAPSGGWGEQQLTLCCRDRNFRDYPATAVIPGTYFAVVSGFAIEGTILDAAGKPVGGATVLMKQRGGDTFRAKPASDGYYYGLLPRGTYTVTAEAKGAKFKPGRCNGSKSQTACVVKLGRDATARADFVKLQQKETLDLIVDRRAVRGDGFGVVHVTVKVTDAEGDPVRGHRIGVFAVGTAIIVCNRHGAREAPSKAEGLADIVTDAQGEAHYTAYVGRDLTGTTIQFVDLDAREDTGPSRAKELDLRLVTRLVRSNGDQPTPARLRTLMDKVAAPGGFRTLEGLPPGDPALQDALIEWLIQLKAGGDLPDLDFFPMTNDLPPFHVLVGFAYSPSGAPGAPPVPIDPDERIRVLDVPAAQQIAVPAMFLPPTLQTLKEWSDQHVASVEARRSRERGADKLTFLSNGIGPYPPPAGTLDRLHFDACLPEKTPEEINTSGGGLLQIYSPLRVMVTDGQGRKLGVDSHGQRFLDVPGSVFVFGRKQQRFLLPAGAYDVSLAGTGRGPATVEVDSGDGAKTRVFTLPVRKGRRGSLRLANGAPQGSLRFGGRRYRARNGLGLVLRGLPRRLRAGKTTKIRLRVRDQVGRPVPDAEVVLKGRRGYEIDSLTDSAGRTVLRVTPPRGRLKLTVGGRGLLRLRRTISAS